MLQVFGVSFRDGKKYLLTDQGEFEDGRLPPGQQISPQMRAEIDSMVAPSTQVVVPEEVSRLQAIIALEQAGLLDTVTAYVAQAPKLTQLAWNNAQSFRRDSPTLLGLAQALSLTAAQLDQLFVAAADVRA